MGATQDPTMSVVTALVGRLGRKTEVCHLTIRNLGFGIWLRRLISPWNILCRLNWARPLMSARKVLTLYQDLQTLSTVLNRYFCITIVGQFKAK